MWLFFSIEISPSNVDVNVHPTKHEVHFLHEDKIIEAIQKAVEEKLLGCNASRTYFTQALLPGAAVPVSSELKAGGGEKRGVEKQQPPAYAYQMVRTDAKEQKLDAFFMPKSLREQQLPQSSGLTEGALSGGEREVKGEESMDVEEGTCSAATGSSKKRPAPSLDQPFKRKVRRKEVKLTSVKTLQQSVRSRVHKGEFFTLKPTPLTWQFQIWWSCSRTTYLWDVWIKLEPWYNIRQNCISLMFLE